MPKNSKTTSRFSSSFEATKERLHALKRKRPHRSFRITARRDAVRKLKLPGYFAFTAQVGRTLWRHKNTFLLLALVFAVLTATLVGISSQSTYKAVSDELDLVVSEVFDGDFDQLSQAGVLFLTAASGSLTQTLSDVQQIYAVLIGIMTWLATVWLLRNLLAGNAVKLRDGLYNSAAPLLSLFIVSLVITVQLLPIALALFGYSAAVSTGFITGGIDAMFFWLVAGGLSLLSIYWVTSTFFALIIATVPGMYPWRAIQIAGDVVVGRRLQLLLRALWAIAVTVIVWALVAIPFILLDSWIKDIWPSIEWLPIVPVVLLLLSSLSVVWLSAYTYMLYRKVIDEEDDI